MSENDTPDEQPANEADANYVAALTREAEGYAAAGREHRVADVNAELKRLGAPLVKGGKVDGGKPNAQKRQTR